MQNSNISSRHLAVLLEQFLADARQAVAIEDGELLFDFATAKYSVSGEGKCILHLWSEERNAVRRVLDAEAKSRILRLAGVALRTVAARICWRSARIRDRRKGSGQACGPRAISAAAASGSCGANIPASESIT